MAAVERTIPVDVWGYHKVLYPTRFSPSTKAICMAALVVVAIVGLRYASRAALKVFPKDRTFVSKLLRVWKDGLPSQPSDEVYSWWTGVSLFFIAGIVAAILFWP